MTDLMGPTREASYFGILAAREAAEARRAADPEWQAGKAAFDAMRDEHNASLEKPPGHWQRILRYRPGAAKPWTCECGRVVPAGVPVLVDDDDATLCLVCADDLARLDRVWTLGDPGRWPLQLSSEWYQTFLRLERQMLARAGSRSDPSPRCSSCHHPKEFGSPERDLCGWCAGRARDEVRDTFGPGRVKL